MHANKLPSRSSLLTPFTPIYKSAQSPPSIAKCDKSEGRVYARLRNVLLRPAADVSPDGVGALFPAAAAVVVAAVFFTVEEGA